MLFSTHLLTIFTLLAATTLAHPGQSLPRSAPLEIFDRAINNGRPVANGACCIENTSKKGDTCNNNGAVGTCKSANTAGCKFLVQETESGDN